MNNYVVQYSGGLGSFGAAYTIIKKYGSKNVKLLFADTLIEDEDLYTFLNETSDFLNCELITVEDGRDPWQVFEDKKFIGNTRIDPCSKILKRDLLRKWIDHNCDPLNDKIVIGIDWTEEHRFLKALDRFRPFELIAPLCDKGALSKNDIIQILKDNNIQTPRLYKMGFPHNNCGGFCIKAGQAQFKKLYEQMPARYLYHEKKENELRKRLNKDVSILRDRTGGKTKPLTLEKLRQRIEKKESIDAFDFGGCGCAID